MPHHENINNKPRLLIPCVASSMWLERRRAVFKAQLCRQQITCEQVRGWQVGGHGFPLVPGDIIGKEIVFETLTNMAVISRNI